MHTRASGAVQPGPQTAWQPHTRKRTILIEDDGNGLRALGVRREADELALDAVRWSPARPSLEALRALVAPLVASARTAVVVTHEARTELVFQTASSALPPRSMHRGRSPSKLAGNGARDGPILVPSAAGLTFGFTAPPVAGNESGLNLLTFGGQNIVFQGQSISGTVVLWSHSLPTSMTGLTLPSVTNQIVEDGDYTGSVQSVRIIGSPFEYAQFFGADPSAALESAFLDFDLSRSSSSAFRMTVGD